MSLPCRLTLALLLAAGLLAPGCGHTSEDADTASTGGAAGTAGTGGTAGSGLAGAGGQSGHGATGGQAGSPQASGHAGTAGQAGSGAQAGEGGGGQAGGGAAGQGGAGGDSGPAGAGGAVKRTVSQRQVMGHALAENLFFDGDFELSSAQQNGISPWLWSGSQGEGVDVELETGGLCRSGLLCGRLKPQELAIALGASAKESAMDASVQVKPLGAASCAKIAVSLTSCISLFSGESGAISLDLTAISTGPDAQGWCSFQGKIGAQIEAACLLVQNQTKADLLVDDAILTASAAPPAGQPLASPAALPPPLPAALQRALPSLQARFHQRAPVPARAPIKTRR